ncbi:thioredoxin domain-containing protein [Leptolyngbya sp. PCC 6406]|uniref:thioredoxin domain-containing protein n=1 Tax=Leptolyngbya sp. PCC 6406 TaxID=1173264 RepID=UPI0002ABA3F9|nr:thioredoxin domain-containing protein [Leptolyngbya sp. PCC 6406]
MANHLADSRSLYLRKHAENPIDWWPWCDEAITLARREQRPIFLSVGYSSCHWCTVMEGEAFSDAAIAAYMNAQFVPIKVDREERPDLDSIYMQALQMMTGHGGWPLNIFLAPDDLVPFYGGTYFPVEPKYGRPGFLQVLQALRRFYDTEPEKVGAVKGEILETLHQGTVLGTTGLLTSELLLRGLEESARILIPRDQGTCFPMIPYASTALRSLRFAPTADGLRDVSALCQQRGLALALGGIFDQVAGGFHRYTVDPTWTVPHFEKMLYDNGQIVEYLADLWSAGYREPAFDRAIHQTVQWLQREMTAPAGYFYAAQDADSFTTATEAEPEEGAFYVWTYGELAAALTPAELVALTEQFTVTPAGNFEGKIVLQRRIPGVLNAALEGTLAKLFAIRYGQPPDTLETFPPARNNGEAKGQSWPGRIPAVTDTKLIVAWNSLMISGLARAAAVMGQQDDGQQDYGQQDYGEMVGVTSPRGLDQPPWVIAVRAAEFILQHQWRGGPDQGGPGQDRQFQRLNYDGEPAVPAQSEDYALFIKALLDLHQAALAWPGGALGRAADWLAQAQRLQAEFDQALWAPAGGYYNTVARGDLLVQERSYQDNATPAANGIAIANLVRLSLLTADLTYRDRADQALQAFSSIMEQMPRACPSLFAALDWFHHGTLVRTRADQIPVLLQQYCPTAVFQLDPDLPPDTVGLVCEGLFCKEPARSWEQLQAQLQVSQRRGMPTPPPPGAD